MHVYAIIDLATDQVAGDILMIHRAEAAAVRAFSDVVTKPGTMMNQHPQDFALYYLGQYDENNYSLTTNSPARIITGDQILRNLNDKE